MAGTTGLEPATSAATVAVVGPAPRNTDPSPAGRSEQALLKDQTWYFVQGKVLQSSRTENPADSAALANRWSPQMKLLLEGRCSHQINDAASCKLSAARKECLSDNWVAKSRT